MKGIFISFEGTEGGGKSTQIQLLAERFRSLGRSVRLLREPGGTPIGEEIRHTLKHSDANHAMSSEAELLLMNASRAQLVREIIRPALAKGEVVLSDRFFDSSVAYQGYGRGLDLKQVRQTIEFAVGPTRPDLTLLLDVPTTTSEERRQARLANAAAATVGSGTPVRDRIEEADRDFFERVRDGFMLIAAEEPARIQIVDATKSVDEVSRSIWKVVAKRFGLAS